MIKKILKDKRVLTFYIIIILALVIGVTYALNTVSLAFNVTTALVSVDETAYGSTTFDSSNIDFKPILDSDVEINNDNVIAIDFKVGGASTNNNDNIIYDIALVDLEMDCNLLNSYIKWKLVKDDIELTNGSFSYTFDTIKDGRMVLTEIQDDLPDYSANQTDYHDYTFYMWFSDSCQDTNIGNCKNSVDQSDLLGKNFSGKVEVELYTEGKKSLSRNTNATLDTTTCTQTSPSYLVEYVTPDACRNANYTGSEQNLIKEAVFNTEGLTFTNYMATDIGKYDVTVSLDDGYTWVDGSTSASTISCPINGNVVYVGNGGSSDTYGNSFTENVVDGSDYSVKENLFTRKGYTFAGWNTKKDGSGTDWTAGAEATWDNDTSVTLYARWRVNTYTINYDGNGSDSGSTLSSTHAYGSVANLTSNGYVRDGYTFEGWNTMADGSGTSYSDGQSVKNLTDEDGAVITLYAQWQEFDSYRITYVGNGSDSGSMTDTVLKFDEPENLSANTYTRTGYTFNGWNTKKDGSGTSYNNSQEVVNLSSTVGEVITLYAQWSAISYNISYDYDGGSKGSNAPATADYDQVVQISNPTRKYTITYNANSTGVSLTSTSKDVPAVFDGWTAISGLNTETVKYGTTNSTVTTAWSSTSTKVKAIYFKNLTSTSNGTVSLKANWTNGSTTLPTYSMAGYNCTWNTQADGGGFSYSCGSSYTPENNITLYLVFSAYNYNISYEYNGGSKGTSAPTVAEYGKVVEISNPIPNSYTVTYNDNSTGVSLSNTSVSVPAIFDGWTATSGLTTATAKYGTTSSTVTTDWSSASTKVKAEYFKNLTSTSNGTVNLLANWTDGSITFDTPNLTGSTCNWNTESDGSGTTYNGGDTYIPTEDITFYVICTKNDYNISYDYNNGSAGSSVPTTAKYDDVIQISNPVPKSYIITYNANSTGVSLSKTTDSLSDSFTGWTATSGLTTATAKYGTTSSTVATAWNNIYTKVTAEYFKNLTSTNNGTVSLKANWNKPSTTLPALAKEGHSCSWNTASDGSGQGYSAGGSYTPTDSITLYAICLEGYNITYTLYDGTSGSNAPIEAEVDEVVQISNPTRSYAITYNANSTGVSLTSTSANIASTFTGWTATGLSTSTAQYGTSSSAVTTSWSNSSTKVKVEYFKNLAEAGGTVNLVANWTSGSTTLPTYSKTGYTCTWNTDSNGTGTSYTCGSSYTPTANIELYLVFVANDYSISYDYNGGSAGTKAPTSAKYDEVVQISNPTSNSYTITYNANSTGASFSSTSDSVSTTFAGWTAASGLTTSTAKYGTTSNPSTSWSYSSTKVTATYFKNLTSTSNGTVNLKANWNSASKTVQANPTKTGYTCNWNTQSNGSGTAYEGGSTITVTDDVTLYARCSANTYTVTFDANGGSVTQTSKDVTYGSTYGTLPTPTKEGSTFDGWYTAKTGGTKVTTTSTVSITAAQTLYAHWTVASYTITIKAGNGISKVALSGWTNTGTATMTKSLEYGSTLNLSTITPTYKNGYSGVSYTKTSGSGSISGSTFTVGEGVTTITLNATTLAAPNPSITTSSTTKVYGASATTLTATQSTSYDSGVSVNYKFGYSSSSTGNYTYGTTSTSTTSSVTSTSHYGTRYYKVQAYATDGTLTSSTATWSSSMYVTLEGTKINLNANSCGTIGGTNPFYAKYGTTNKYTTSTGTTSATGPTFTASSGYTFDGWYTAASGGSQVLTTSGALTGKAVSGYTTASAWAATTEKTLYAQCSVNSYTITIKAGNGISKVALSGWTNTGTATMTKSLSSGSTLNLSTITPTYKTGYSGVSYTKTSGSGSISGSTFTVGEGVTTITLNATTLAAPNPSITTSNTTKVYGASSTTLTATNSTSYDSGVTVYYAFGSRTGSTGTYTYGSALSNKTLTVTATSHYGTTNYKVQAYATDGTLTSSTATWSSSMYVTLEGTKINLNANSCGTIGGTNPFYAKYGTTNKYTTSTGTTSATGPTFTASSGYTFDGWYTAASGGSQVLTTSGALTGKAVSGYTTASAWAATTEKTLYAQCTSNTVTVYYNTNGGTVGNSSYSADSSGNIKSGSTKFSQTFNKSDGAINLEDISNTGFYITKTGYTYDKENKPWNTNSSGTGTGFSYYNGETTAEALYNAATSCTNGNCTLTLYVKWVASTYKVTFDANGGSVSTTSKDVTYDSTYGTLPTPTRTNYTFNGWYTAKTGGTKVTASTKVTITAAQTLYAQWTSSDSTAPVATITSTSDLAKTSQTATLKCTDSVGVVSYYWGTTSPTSSTSYTSVTSTTSMSVTKSVSSNGTYYLACKDAGGNVSTTVNKVYVRYRVNNMLQKVSGTAGTYTTANYEQTSTSPTSTSQYYLIPSGTAVVFANVYTKPTGGTFAGGSIGAASTTAPSSGTVYTKQVVYDENDDGKVISMWFNRNSVTVYFNANGGTSSSHSLDSSGNVLKSGSTKESRVYVYGQTGINLPDVTSGSFNMSKDAYSTKSGENWNTKADGSGTTFSHLASGNYSATDFCSNISTNSNCSAVTLYVKWVTTALSVNGQRYIWNAAGYIMGESGASITKHSSSSSSTANSGTSNYTTWQTNYLVGTTKSGIGVYVSKHDDTYQNITTLNSKKWIKVWIKQTNIAVSEYGAGLPSNTTKVGSTTYYPVWLYYSTDTFTDD